MCFTDNVDIVAKILKFGKLLHFHCQMTSTLAYYYKEAITAIKSYSVGTRLDLVGQLLLVIRLQFGY